MSTSALKDEEATAETAGMNDVLRVSSAESREGKWLFQRLMYVPPAKAPHLLLGCPIGAGRHVMSPLSLRAHAVPSLD
eukprot:471734-Pleurochrysis_carterae.AAC.3